MPGYDRSRIVGESEEDLEEFTCGICLEVFIKPTSTQCCGQTFCFDCINEWLQENNTCPNDREILTTDQLKPSPKIVTNLLNNMKIKCDFHDKGCEVVVKINDLEKHIESVCGFNPSRKCENCGKIKLNHSDKDCIKSLVRRLNDLQKEYDQLRQKNDTEQFNYEKLKVDFDCSEQINEALTQKFNDLQKEHAQFKEKIELVQIETDLHISELLMKYEKLQIESDKIKSLNDDLKKKILELNAKNCELDDISNNLPEICQNNWDYRIKNLNNRMRMDQFIGKWEICSNENFDDLLKELGYSYLTRLTVKWPSKLEFCLNGDYFEMKWDCLSVKFKLGEEYEEEVMGQKIKSVTVMDGNKMIKRQKENGIEVTYVREIFKGKVLTVDIEANNVKSFRIYKRIT